MTYSCPQGRAGDGAQMKTQVTVVQSQVGRASEEAQETEAYSAVFPAPSGIRKPTFFGYSRLFLPLRHLSALKDGNTACWETLRFPGLAASDLKFYLAAS